MADHSVLNIVDLDDVTFDADDTATGTERDLEKQIEAQVLVNITAITGSPSLVITAQVMPVSGVWVDHTALAAITAVGTYRLALANFGDAVRLQYVTAAGGTLTGSAYIKAKS